jgi:hypothetical protein
MDGLDDWRIDGKIGRANGRTVRQIETEVWIERDRWTNCWTHIYEQTDRRIDGQTIGQADGRDTASLQTDTYTHTDR